MGIGRKDPIGFRGYAAKPAYEMRGYEFLQKQSAQITSAPKKAQIFTISRAAYGDTTTFPNKMCCGSLLVSFEDTLQ